MTLPTARLIRLNSLKRYLAESGWSRHSLPSGVEVFASSIDDEIEIVLPSTSKARDLVQRVDSALDTLTAIEKRTVNEIVAAISSIGYDLIKSKLQSNSIRSDTIKLKTAEEFIRRMSRLLGASAHGEYHADPYYDRIDLNAQKFADDCRFGHTFAGSFGFTVESPVGPHTPEIGLGPATAPVERRIVQRLARGLLTVQKAVERAAPEDLVLGSELGLNANACEELAGLIETPQVGQIDFEIVFSPEWRAAADLEQIARIAIGGPYTAEMLKSGAKLLRHVDYEKRRAVTGKVHTLHSTENPSDLLSVSGLQDVVVEWISGEFGRKNVRVPLGPEEYLQAVEAHKSFREIYVYGELEQGRQWRLVNARDFRLL